MSIFLKPIEITFQFVVLGIYRNTNILNVKDIGTPSSKNVNPLGKTPDDQLKFKKNVDDF